MIHASNSDKTQLDALISYGMSDRQTIITLPNPTKNNDKAFC
ncbi:hypothetical protein GXM_04025 [Nostoc sphaeroides CCNUC1]|uniref:Uncharacterized protein n=1 Tax=Nostoc sphaeroides CCNUC1 TaxID=2653204 RepID=A0A5P8W1R9_9NOSO|nr:hypothetical protein GXM_04025 [Nostoc sphaeroides CCNUC1]